MNFSTPEKSTISSKRRRTSARVMPRMAPFRNTFSRPVSSGWKPVPTSSRLATRPLIETRPSVGSVMRDRTLSSVVLPAPLWPMMLTTSPRLISKSTSRSAQNSSTTSPSTMARPRTMSAPLRSALRKPRDSASTNTGPASVRWPMMNFLPSFSARMTTSDMSDHVGEGAFAAAEGTRAPHQHAGDDDEADQEARPVDRAVAAQDAPAEAIDHADHGIDAVEHLPVLGHDLAGETDRRDVEANLGDEGDDEAEVAIFDDQRGRPDRRPDRRQQRQQDEDRQQQDLPAGHHAVPQHEAGQDRETHEEIDQRDHDRRQRHDQTREVDLGDQVGAADHADRGLAQHRGE